MQHERSPDQQDTDQLVAVSQAADPSITTPSRAAQGVSAQLAKLCFDALVQRDLPEWVRTSVFAWSETMLQMLWVLGGGLGIVLPLAPHVGFPVCAVAIVGAVLMAARQRRRVDLDGAGPRGTMAA